MRHGVWSGERHTHPDRILVRSLLRVEVGISLRQTRFVYMTTEKKRVFWHLRSRTSPLG